MIKLNVNLDKRSYPIYISTGFKELGTAIVSAKLSGKALLVTDSNVDRLFSEELTEIIGNAGMEVKTFVFEAGENSKNLDTVRKIYEACLEHKMDRRSAIFAAGGGVTGDMAGFAAATYLRGVHYIQIPTTTLAQADSSVGGKVGVDFEGAKNMVGAFYQPKFVYMNVEALKRLPEREYKSGLAEMIKHGIIYDEEFFHYIHGHLEKILAVDNDTMMYVAKRNCAIKGEVVEKDEREDSLRAILNFGHTLGHAVESTSNFTLLHGECVSIGMVGAALISHKMGIMQGSEVRKVTELLQKAGLPVTVRGIYPDRIYEAMQYDKKMENSRLKFILPRKIGQVIQHNQVPESIIREVLQEICGK